MTSNIDPLGIEHRTEPRTAAGRNLAHLGCCTSVDDILAIEAEARAEVYALLPLERETARAAALDEARAAVAGILTLTRFQNVSFGGNHMLSQEAVLAAIDALREDSGHRAE